MSSALPAADRYCTNLAFELGNFSNWQGFTWINSTLSNVSSTDPVFSFAKHTIMEDTNAYDSRTNYQLKTIPAGYRYSVRLGDVTANTTAQSLRYTLTVDSSNCFLTYKFAVVLLNPLDGHEKYEEPRFKVTLYDSNHNEIPDCSNYDVYASDAELNNSFNVYQAAGSDSPVLWRDWTTVGANLLPYIGQTITMEFMSSDCTHRGHYGYAYLVAECQPLNISVEFCANDTNATLTAPVGFETYSWMNESNVFLGPDKTLMVSSPAEGSIYACEMQSATGCTVTLNTKIERFDPQPDFTTAMVDCNSNEVQFTNTSTSTKGSLEYKWDFGDGATATEPAPKHKFTTSGLHQVSLELSNPPSVCSVVLKKTVESFSPPLVGITGDSTYCPQQPVVLRGRGAYQYKWSNGSEADSIVINPPGGKVWMLGKSSTGCISDIVYKVISAEPDWQLTLPTNAVFCVGDSALLSATGAVSYLWNTDETSSQIYASTSGTYTLTARNLRGCAQTKSIQVDESASPDADFSLGAETIDSKNNKLTCRVANPLDGVDYDWTFAEQNSTSSETGSQVIHTYTDIEMSAIYKVTLTATSQAGCVSTVSKTILSVPFFPNVFTPNGDAKNELFCKGFEVQIIDRYGMVLYVGNGGWDGKYDGKNVPQDAYFYFVSYTDYLGQVQTHKGSITLLR